MSPQPPPNYLGDSVDLEEPVVGTVGLIFIKIEGKEEYAVKDIGTATATRIVIPEIYEGLPVTSIGSHAFYNCYSLTSIKYRGSELQRDAISKGYGWDYNTGAYTITYNYTGE